MASSFYIDLSMTATPIEVTPLTDPTQTVRSIHSSIDKSVSGYVEKSFGTTSTFVNYVTYACTTTGVALDSLSATIPNTCNRLVIVIKSAVSSGTPDVYLSLNGGSTYPIILSGLGDFCVIPMNLTSHDDIYIKSSGSTTRANIDVLVGGA